MRSVIATEVIPNIVHARRGGRVLSAEVNNAERILLSTSIRASEESPLSPLILRITQRGFQPCLTLHVFHSSVPFDKVSVPHHSNRSLSRNNSHHVSVLTEIVAGTAMDCSTAA
jgi:hypothetical protein